MENIGEDNNVSLIPKSDINIEVALHLRRHGNYVLLNYQILIFVNLSQLSFDVQ